MYVRVSIYSSSEMLKILFTVRNSGEQIQMFFLGIVKMGKTGNNAEIAEKKLCWYAEYFLFPICHLLFYIYSCNFRSISYVGEYPVNDSKLN